jgi:hypothetical protein
MLTWTSTVRARTSAISQPTASPIAMPPAAAPTNLAPASAAEKLPLTTAATATR